jgi:hypothetical protein
MNLRGIEFVFPRLDPVALDKGLTDERHVEAGPASGIGTENIARQAPTRTIVKAEVAADRALIVFDVDGH